LVVPPGAALDIVVPLFMLVDAATLKLYWWQWPSAEGLMIGAVPGCIISAALYAVVDGDVFRLLIGVICLAFVAFQVSRAGLAQCTHYAVFGSFGMVCWADQWFHQLCQSCGWTTGGGVFAVVKAKQNCVPSNHGCCLLGRQLN
jgi:hypothetical protein